MNHVIRRHVKLYFQCLKTIISGETAYRLNFILELIMTLLGNIMFPLITILIYANGQSFPDWTIWQVLLIQGVFTIASGISETFFEGIFWNSNTCIKEGSLDVVLLKPVNSLFYMAATSVNLYGISFIIGGLIMLFISAPHCVSISLAGILNFILFGCSGIFVMLGATFIMSATVFKWVGNSRIPEIFQSMQQFAKYPITVYPRMIQTISLFVIPVGMISFIPAQALMGQISPAYYLAIIPCILFAAFGAGIFQFMVHLYESAGG